MTHNYTISGMTCTSCQAKVSRALSAIDGVTGVSIDLPTGEASITMSKHVPTAELQRALSPYPAYRIDDAVAHVAVDLPEEESRSFLQTYKPVLLVLAYITGATLLAEAAYGDPSLMRWMNHFMAAFFLVFSFFKLIDLKGFAENYASYDIVAARWNAWGYIYPFVELALGIAFLTGFSPILTNWVTVIVMTVSIIGVLRSLLKRRKIRCACLGAVFNLPMSTITVIEDAAMIGMSAAMLTML